MASRPALSSAVSSVVAGSGFVPVWLATGVLLVVAELIAPETLSGSPLRSGVLPFMTFLAVAALGEMLVIMTGGIDLCIPGVIVLVANVVVGVSSGENGRLPLAILVCLAASAAIGLVNGLLVGVGGLNPLIVTLAVGQIVVGVTVGYARSIANESAVPTALSSFYTQLKFKSGPNYTNHTDDGGDRATGHIDETCSRVPRYWKWVGPFCPLCDGSNPPSGFWGAPFCAQGAVAGSCDGALSKWLTAALSPM